MHFDPKLRDEIVARVEKLNLPSYTGFVMPKLEPVKSASGEVTDVVVSYPMDLTKQMLEYLGGHSCAPVDLVFSSRIAGDLAPNRLTEILRRRRADGRPVIDLTESNPTRVGLDYPPDLLAPLADCRGLTYAPQPFGLAAARQAVADDYRRRGIAIGPDRVALTASTSEAYSLLFKLLAAPGDEILVPRPSYPLFEHLTALDGLTARPYDLEYNGVWSIDFASVDRVLGPRTRAVLLVNPNNPTGSVASQEELDRLATCCRRLDAALIADEVFADYQLEPAAANQIAAAADAR